MRGVFLWGPAFVWYGLISFLSHQPSLRVPGGTPDWLLHGLEYAILAFFVLRGVRGGVPVGARVTVLLVIPVCAVGAILDEYHQSFIPGRTASPGDVAADIAGAGIAVAAWLLVSGGRVRTEVAEVAGIGLFGRKRCHLCDEAEETLKRVLPEYGLEYKKIDVDADPAMKEKYGAEVPVMLLDGRKVFKYRIDEPRLRRMLETRIKRSG